MGVLGHHVKQTDKPRQEKRDDNIVKQLPASICLSKVLIQFQDWIVARRNFRDANIYIYIYIYLDRYRRWATVPGMMWAMALEINSYVRPHIIRVHFHDP